MIYILKIQKFNFLIEESDNCIVRLEFTDKKETTEIKTELMKKLYKELNDYFSGELKYFTIPIKPKGSEFQMKVWNELQNIKYGKTTSYKEIAKNIGNSKSYRAVGNANGKNPIAIIIPCHRVINSNGKIGGYTGGIDKKNILLNIENGKSGR